MYSYLVLPPVNWGFYLAQNKPNLKTSVWINKAKKLVKPPKHTWSLSSKKKKTKEKPKITINSTTPTPELEKANDWESRELHLTGFLGRFQTINANLWPEF